MSWRDHIANPAPQVIPWLGGRTLLWDNKSWQIEGRLPHEIGWFWWHLKGRKATVNSQTGAPFMHNMHDHAGYVVGNRFIPALVMPKKTIVQNSHQIYLVEDGLDRFSLVSAISDSAHRYIYKEWRMPLGPEDEVRRAFVDRLESVDHIKDVIPALNVAFQFATHQRQLHEERRERIARERALEEARIVEEDRRQEALGRLSSSTGRRTLAATDFEAAAAAALRVGGAELLDTRNGYNRDECVVQYRLLSRRFECVVSRQTLQVIDSGICLTDEYTGEKGDTYFTLESLPSVVKQAIDLNVLVIYRHME